MSEESNKKPSSLPNAASADAAAIDEIDEIEPVGLEEQSETELAGTVLADRYELKRKIGQGGMGAVYLAYQEALDRYVVVKVLSRDVINDKNAEQRFEREARRLSSLGHPNIVTVHDFGRHQGLSYLVMEYVEGETLKDLLRRRKHLSLRFFLRIADQILDAVASAHQKGIMHRDLKPSNIMLYEGHGRRYNVKVLDFGLAKLASGGGELTRKKELIGSPPYIAPEQILGKDFDVRVDVYALGVLFYSMLCGQRPFDAADDMSLLYMHVHEPVPPLEERLPESHDIPPNLIDIVYQCLAKDPVERPKDAGELRDMLYGRVYQSEVSGSLSDDFALTPSSSRSRPMIQSPATGSQTGMQPAGGRMLTALLAVALLGVGGLAAWLYMRPNGSHEAPKAAATAAAAATAKNNESDQISRVLDQVDTLAKQGKYAQGRMLLDKLDSHLLDHPDLMVRAVSLEDSLAIGQLMEKAKGLEKSGDADKAIEVYKQILARNSDHAEARARLEALVKAKQKDAPAEKVVGEKGTLHVESTPEATVYVDNLPVGKTPVDQKIAPGKHTVELGAAGYRGWSTSFELASAGEKTFNIKLTPIHQKSTLSKARRAVARHRAAHHDSNKAGGRAGSAKKTHASAPAVAQADEKDAGGANPAALAATGSHKSEVPATHQGNPEPRTARQSARPHDTSGTSGPDKSAEASPSTSASAPTPKPAPTHPEPKKTAPKKIASPNLPSTAWVRNLQNLRSILVGIEREVVAKNDLSRSKVRNTTALLYRAVQGDLAPGSSITLNARKIYYIIARGVRDGKGRMSVARSLVSSYRAGALR